MQQRKTKTMSRRLGLHIDGSSLMWACMAAGLAGLIFAPIVDALIKHR
jgi:threonine aldolase